MGRIEDQLGEQDFVGTFVDLGYELAMSTTPWDGGELYQKATHGRDEQRLWQLFCFFGSPLSTQGDVAQPSEFRR